MRNINIYEDEYLVVRQSEIYSNVPGFYTITVKKDTWDNSLDSIDRLSMIEKKIRDVLFEVGIELVGIYNEQSEDRDFIVFVIPYHIKKLKLLGISPDLYQPHIPEYLQSFDVSNKEDVYSLNEKMIRELKYNNKRGME